MDGASAALNWHCSAPNSSLVTVRRAFLNPLWLILSLPGYIGWRLLPALSMGPLGICAGIALLILCCVVIPLSVRNRSLRNPQLADLLAWVGLLSMGFFSSLFVLTLLRDCVLLVAHLLLSAPQAASLTAPSARWTLALTVVVTLAGLVIARGRPRIVDVDIPVTDLPKALHGFSIAQISDVHVGPTIKRGFVEAIVALVNGLKTDLIAVTGDLVDGSVQQLSPHTAPLAGLAARHGVYFVTGNHEYYSGERAWTAELRRLGLRVLKNEHVVLHHDGASLVLAGVTDLSAHHFDAAEHSDPTEALRGAPSDAGAKILLAHQPNSAMAAAGAGFDVQLSGHTHGGQFWPWNLFVRFFQPFTGGLYRLKNLWVYVSRGTGYWGPPNRFGVPPEITRIRLIAVTP
jgi:predicted MPP superfamily phosphohydrolase